VCAVDEVLRELPAEDGPPTAIFLLSFLAVGGAESLLFDLLEGLSDRFRLLVVTVEPHLESLGQTVDRCRRLTPHVYTLGDWLPREAIHGAVRHLIRRWQVASLVSWNGSTYFYDNVSRLRSEHPQLRILNQLFNHHGGWMEHYSPRLVADVDIHLAVNHRIAQTFVEDRGVPEDRVVTVHHGVRVPPLPGPAELARRKLDTRQALGLPPDALVAGTFIRLHPQKRPLDVVRLARRMAGRGVHFLLVGGGPLDADVDRSIAASPVPALTRLPMRRDASELYDALDLCLLVSEYEGLPVFVLDGLARGIPCVATAVGEIPTLLTDGGGVLVDRVGDLEALEAAILELSDHDRRCAEGAAGRATVERRFGVDRYVQAYRSVIFPDLG
jgi:glycosyltransferase involved in cell wall biosynthesis